ncbi:MAG: lipopolysaccharide heptosyltransferase II [Candidatus Omnitrophica bacterium]|nr:lipopolysaccharide heptosyltransferase II [Candidatus Omnitrophota bacterium]MDD5238443.1 lipopolysaccharide heptosyltransferase II [Candidatus Omnitrophota bacterium]
MKILFITLSNIGDVILTLPALDFLRAAFKDAKITCLLAERPREIFENNPDINRVIIYDKRAKLKEKIRLFHRLRKEKFDLVVDLRNTLLGVFLTARYRTSPFLAAPGDIKHMHELHLYKVKRLISKHKEFTMPLQNNIQRNSFYINQKDQDYINQVLRENNISQEDKIIIIAPGARSHIKRWPEEKFSVLIEAIIEEFGAKIILVGDKDDSPVAKYISGNLRYQVLDLSAKTTLGQLACLLKRAKLVITNDSAVLHLASYVDAQVLALFGPTNEQKYGPWSKTYSVVKKDIFCRPCEKAQCRFKSLDCLKFIKPQDVLREVRNILLPGQRLAADNQRHDYKRILIVRTDRIGDVLLSTPVIKALRDEYPHAYIAMMVCPAVKDIVDGNPYLDEVIIYDKDGKHKSWFRSIKFTLRLRKKRFDLAIVLHPINRVHLITYFCGIPERIGYDRKLGFLLTQRLKHIKQLGQRHELEYNLDLLRQLGIEPKDKQLFMPIKKESEEWLEEFFRAQNLKASDKLLAIHPAASCPSKIWPNERFAEVADRLIEKLGFKVLVVAGPRDLTLAQNLIQHMHHTAINLAGKTSISQLASILKRCQLFISNDSGPVHIACGVGTPVISIFGRNQKGLSPKRWGPLGDRVEVLHKEVGCIECLAHNCIKEFACLKAITVDDVLKAADRVMSVEK